MLAIHSDPADLVRLHARWKALAAATPGYGPFLGPDWAALWWDTFGADSDLLLLDHDGPSGGFLMALHRRPDGRILFVGGEDVTDYVGVVGAPDAHAGAGETLVDWLAGRDDWTSLEAVAVPAESGFTVAAALAAVRHGFDVTFRNEDSARMRLPGSWAAYLERIGKKERHELRRKERRLERELGELDVRSEPVLPEDVDRFVAWHRQAAGDKGQFMDEPMAAFFRGAARRFAGTKALRLDTLFAGGEAVAATFGFADAAGYYLYNSAYDPEVAVFSPGNVLLGFLIRKEIEEGVPVFDFLRGHETYKFRLGAEARPLRRLRVARPVHPGAAKGTE